MQVYEKVRRAQKQADAELGFYVHAAAFAVVLIILTGVNYASGDEWWVQWVWMGWGIGLALHGAFTIGKMPRFVRDWQLRKIRTLTDQMR